MCFHTHTNLQTVQPRRTIGVGVSHSRTIHSHDITSSDTMSTQSLTPAVLANRMADPLTWPCGCDGINGVTRQNCRAPCCIVPATTPDGQDTPAWAAKVALREEIESGIAQPNFGTPGSPNITTKFTHEAVSGYTFEGMSEATRNIMRVSTKHEGAPGSSKDDAVDLNTPKK